MSGTRFCPRNAASNHGANIAEGEQAFKNMFTDSVPGAYSQVRKRCDTHLKCSPTDDQAEVLVPDRISLDDISAIAISTEAQAKNEFARFEILEVSKEKVNFVIAPDLFRKQALSNAIRSGQRPQEIPWTYYEGI